MEDNLNDGDRLLRSIGSIWGQLSNYFRPASEGVHTAEFDAEEAKRQRQLDKELKKAADEYEETKNIRAASPPLRRAYNDPREQYLAEQDKDLDAVLESLTEIKLRTKQMGALLDSSNSRLGDMQDRTERTNSRVVGQTKLATKYAQ